jgi:hypothetical protein
LVRSYTYRVLCSLSYCITESLLSNERFGLQASCHNNENFTKLHCLLTNEEMAPAGIATFWRCLCAAHCSAGHKYSHSANAHNKLYIKSNYWLNLAKEKKEEYLGIYTEIFWDDAV